MPRLFTGLEVPAALTEHLSGLRFGLPNARFVEPSDYHITLRFISDVDIRMANEIADMLFSVRRKKLTLRLSELRSFGKDAPHAVVAMIAASSELNELAAEHERIMQRLGLPPEPRKFSPHVTIARLKNGQHHHVGEWIVDNSPLPSAPFSIERFVLYSSKASVGGGPYLVEGAYPLL